MRLPRSSMRLRLGVEVGAELREGRQFAELRQVALDAAGHLLHRLDLRGRTDAGHGETDRDGGPDALVEQVGLQEDLAVGDRDDVGRNVGRDVARLRLDDRQRGQRTVAVLLAQRAPRARAGGCADRTRRPGYASRPDGRFRTSDTWR